MIKHKELEVKYDAKDISLAKFEKVVDSYAGNSPISWLMVSSYDDYYCNSQEDFIRHRYRDNYSELTIKRKTTPANNNTRVEVNLKCDGNTIETVAAFADLLGYTKSFSVYKTCKIAFLNNLVIAYYIVYDADLVEKRRFVEIEANESYPWSSEEEAWDHIERFEEENLSTLGLSSRNRLKKSLFEFFKPTAV
jgi:adenylate cyclase class IV